jgi:hypothetical protein
MVSLFWYTDRLPVYLSAAIGNRIPEAVIKINRKEALRLKHIGVYSTRMNRLRQEAFTDTRCLTIAVSST